MHIDDIESCNISSYIQTTVLFPNFVLNIISFIGYSIRFIIVSSRQPPLVILRSLRAALSKNSLMADTGLSDHLAERLVEIWFVYKNDDHWVRDAF